MSRTTDKFKKVSKETQQAPENEIRIKASAPLGRYISYAAKLFHEKKLDTIVLKASGNAVRGACQIAEILRHKIKGLHQLNKLDTVSVVDEYEPKEAGLDRVKVERHLAVLEISLSSKAGFDTKAPGYQAPLPDSEVQVEDLESIIAGRRGGGFGGSRGGRGGRGGRDRDDDRDRDRGERGEYRGEYRGRGRGRGRNYDDRRGGDRRGGGYGSRDNYGGNRDNYGGGRGGYDDRDRGDRVDRDRGDRGERGEYRGSRRGGRGGFRSRGGPTRGGDRERRRD